PRACATTLCTRLVHSAFVTVGPGSLNTLGSPSSLPGCSGTTVTNAEWTNLVHSVVAQARGTDTGVVTVSGSLPGGVGREQVAALLSAGEAPCYVDTSGPALR